MKDRGRRTSRRGLNHQREGKSHAEQGKTDVHLSQQTKTREDTRGVI